MFCVEMMGKINWHAEIKRMNQVQFGDEQTIKDAIDIKTVWNLQNVLVLFLKNVGKKSNQELLKNNT